MFVRASFAYYLSQPYFTPSPPVTIASLQSVTYLLCAGTVPFPTEEVGCQVLGPHPAGDLQLRTRRQKAVVQEEDATTGVQGSGLGTTEEILTPSSSRTEILQMFSSRLLLMLKWCRTWILYYFPSLRTVKKRDVAAADQHVFLFFFLCSHKMPYQITL